MVLNNLQLANTNNVIDIRINGKLITGISKGGMLAHSDSLNLTFENAMVLPGLINSHDHLDFNLFAQLGSKVYNNYTEWGPHIHKTYKDEINAVLRVPKELRIEWGVYKNLLCGVTTVINHGKRLRVKNDLITVLQDCQSLHSMGFEKKLKLKLNNPLKINKTVAIHVGEGTDDFAAEEIDKLTKWNLLNRDVVGIHGVAMNAEQAKKFKALVWCPASNYFLLNKTADVNELKNNTTICFGSDSTLTADWNIWNHIQQAQTKIGLTQSELIAMLTENPAIIWKLNGGRIAEGRDADIVITKTPCEGLVSNINPEEILLVIHKGEICLFDDSIFSQLNPLGFNKPNFSAIEMRTCVKHIKGNIRKLLAEIKVILPEAQLPVKPENKLIAV